MKIISERCSRKPLSIFTATVLQLALPMPNADACITLPKAPQPRGFSGGDTGGRGRLTVRGEGALACLIQDPSLMKRLIRDNFRACQTNPTLMMGAH